MNQSGTEGSADTGTADRIIDAAVVLAEEVGWDHLRLREVAARLAIPLAELRRHFRDQDAIADAWFDRAHQAMLAREEPDFATLPGEERVFQVMMRWFDALASHREVSVEMIGTKIYPSHPHHWVPLIFNLSRHIQWIREAARLDAAGLRRQAEEVALTGLFLAALAVWARDGTPGQERTRHFLRRRLERMHRIGRRFTPRRW